MCRITNMTSVLTAVLAACVLPCGQAAADVALHVDDDASPGGDGLTWPTAYRFLQDALADAAASAGEVTEIRVAQGSYLPDRNEAHPGGTGNSAATFELLNGVALLGGYAGQGAPDPDARDVDLYETVLSGDLLGNDVGFLNNDENSWHIVTGSGTGPTAEIDGFTVTAGNADGPGYPPDLESIGAGMFNYSGSPAVGHCRFVANWAEDAAAGMFNIQGSNPTVTACIFEDNEVGATDPDLGGAGGMGNVESNPIISRCEFRNNVSQYGGGIYNQEGDPLITGCIFIGNTADWGGGLRNWGCNPTVVNCTFAGNTARQEGGGIQNWNSDPVVANTILWSNVNGQIADHGTSTTIISYSDIHGGHAGTGNIYEDPLLVDPDHGDYHLSPGSRCIDVGDNAAVPPGTDTDLDGNPRFHDDAGSNDCWQLPGTCGDPPIVDMGAYEFQGTSCPWDCSMPADGQVSVTDFLALLSQWGNVGSSCDFDGGGVSVTDFLALLAWWGPCP